MALTRAGHRKDQETGYQINAARPGYLAWPMRAGVSPHDPPRFTGARERSETAMVSPYRTDRSAADPEQAYVDTARWGQWVVTAAALICGLAAAGIIGTLFPTLLAPGGIWVLLAVGCVSVTVLAPVLWSWLVVDGRGFRVDLGVLAGVLTVALSHFAATIGGLIVLAIMDHGTISDFPDLIESFGLIIMVGTGSLFIAGWITVPVGAVGGWIIAVLCRRRLRRALQPVR